jgi:hypothetical protein
MAKNRIYTHMLIAITVLGFHAPTNCMRGNIDFHIYSNHYFVHRITAGDIGRAGLILGAIGLITYGAVTIGSWLLSKSDETITQQAQKAYHEALGDYMQMTKLLAQPYAEYITHNNMHMIAVSEQTLYELAKNKYHDAGIVAYIRTMRMSLKSLEYYHKELVSRLRRIDEQIYEKPELTHLYNKMKSVDQQLQEIWGSVDFLYNYLKTHQGYFEVFEIEDVLMSRYGNDLHELDLYQDDIHHVPDIMHRLVMLAGRNHNSIYPYRWYMQRLEDDIYRLNAKINACTYEYTNRIHVASQLKQKLELIRQAIVSSRYYLDELRAYEYAQCIQASINVQNYQAMIEEQEVYELQRQNNLLEQMLTAAVY